MSDETKLRRLEGLDWKPGWVSHLGCLHGCLDYLGIKISDGWLFGGTGHAFVMNVHEVLCPSGPTAWNTEMLFKLGGNLGYRIDRVCGHRTQVDLAERQRMAWEAARAAIDDGLPCFGWELDLPEYYVVQGYDDDAYHFSGPLCGPGKGTKPWRELGDTEIGWLEMCSVRPGDAADDATVVREALTFAVETARVPARWVSGPYRMGLEAYDLWIGAMEEGKAHGLGTAYNAQVWAECRGFAVQFLDEAGQRLGGKRHDDLEEAWRHYGAVADAHAAIGRLFPFAGVSDEERDANVLDDKRRQECSERLRGARADEEAGLRVLERIAEAL
jgi:hypothetical protein